MAPPNLQSKRMQHDNTLNAVTCLIGEMQAETARIEAQSSAARESREKADLAQAVRELQHALRGGAINDARAAVAEIATTFQADIIAVIKREMRVITDDAAAKTAASAKKTGDRIKASELAVQDMIERALAKIAEGTKATNAQIIAIKGQINAITDAAEARGTAEKDARAKLGAALSDTTASLAARIDAAITHINDVINRIDGEAGETRGRLREMAAATKAQLEALTASTKVQVAALTKAIQAPATIERDVDGKVLAVRKGTKTYAVVRHDNRITGMK